MKKQGFRILAVLMSMCMLFTSSLSALTLTYTDSDGKKSTTDTYFDTAGHWAESTIYKWSEYGIISGSNARFNPNDAITRGDFAIIIDNLIGMDSTVYNYFSDLNNGDYFANSLLSCVAEGYIYGTSSSTINPRGATSREEAAVILCRVFNIDNSYSGSTGFLDDAKISSWAVGSIYAMKQYGFMSGSNGYVNPQDSITRAELLTIINNICSVYVATTVSGVSNSAYKGTYTGNLVLARSVTLDSATVTRDVYLTNYASSLTLNNTTIAGRIVAKGASKITLNNSTVSEILLTSGVSSIFGVGDNIGEITVMFNASGSVLDAVPDKITLEPNTSVKIAGVTYENTYSYDKTYYSDEIYEALAEDNGYVTGGPKISGGTFSLGYDNVLEVSNINITVGDNDIDEVGVMWLYYDIGEEDYVIPTYSNKDDKETYSEDAYEDSITIEVDDIEDTAIYRVYVVDDKGLYGYGNYTSITANDFEIELSVYDEEYPKSIRVEVEFEGENIPSLSSVQVVYDTDDSYDSEHSTKSLSKYTDIYDPTDDSEYMLYYATILSDSYTEDGEIIYEPPTEFGYILKFGDGSYVYDFPILSDVEIEGVSPISTLKVGDVAINGSYLELEDNKVVTSGTSLLEVGVAYNSGNSLSVTDPNTSSSGWTRICAEKNIDSNDTEYFDVSVPLDDSDVYTHYALYVRTTAGYYYGDVNYIVNDTNTEGDEDGPVIEDVIVTVLSDDTVMLNIDLDKKYADLDSWEKIFKRVSIDGVYVSDFSNTYLYDVYVGSDASYNLVLLLEDLDPGYYNMTLQFEDIYGSTSAQKTVYFDTSNYVVIGVSDKVSTANGTQYSINLPGTYYSLNTEENSYISNNLGSYGLSVSTANNTIILEYVVAGTTIDLGLQYKYYSATGAYSKYLDYTQTITLW